MDGPLNVEDLLGFAISEFNWRPNDFYNCPVVDFAQAIRVYQQKRFADDYIRFNDFKRLAFSIAEIMVGTPDKINDYYNVKTSSLQPLEDKMAKLNQHFKDKI